MSIRVAVGLGAGIVGAVLGTAAPAALVVNELLVDPAGSDDGREFVELLNTGPDPVDLGGVTFEFANGSAGDAWTVRWRGTPGAALPPGARLLLVDRNWTGVPAGDAEADLGLQNGPDAVRVAREGLTLDLVGYGVLTDPGLFEGAPVAVPTGRSLARRPDGRDTGNNAADFVPADPTPGAPNFLPHHLAAVSVVHDPPVVAAPGGVLRVGLVVVNRGTEVLPAGPCALAGGGARAAAWWDGAQPGEERLLAFVLRPERRGAWPLVFSVAAAPAETLRLDAGTIRVGAGPLRLNEVLVAPETGQGEWVELAWDGPGPVDLGGYVLSDADGGRAVLPPVSVPAGGLLVVAADSVALAGWWRANAASGLEGCPGSAPAGRLRGARGWPALNNTPPAGRPYADRLVLADPDGAVQDAFTWGGPGGPVVERGRSLERLGPEPRHPAVSAWAASTAAAGATPGCANAVAGPPAGPPAAAGVTVAPAMLDRARGVTAVHLRFTLVPGEVGWEARVYDTFGDQRRHLGGDRHGPGPRDLPWDGRDDRGRPLPPGLYVLWWETRDADGVPGRRERTPVVIR